MKSEQSDECDRTLGTSALILESRANVSQIGEPIRSPNLGNHQSEYAASVVNIVDLLK